MTAHNEALKHAGDIGASIASLFLAISHFAEIVTPILTMLIALATAGWWAVRWWRFWHPLPTQAASAVEAIDE